MGQGMQTSGMYLAGAVVNVAQVTIVITMAV